MKTPQVYWITGLSGAGKTTVATKAFTVLNSENLNFTLLDGDDVRDGLCRDLRFSIEDRTENIRRVAEVCKLFLKNGTSCICTFISPTEAIRELAEELIGKERFNEIYINTPLEICENRDPKGLYKKVRNGEISNFTGISSAYEPPLHPTLILDCVNLSIEDSVSKIIEFIKSK